MKKTKIPNLDLNLYNEKLENGLEIYIIPKTDVNDIYVQYVTKYGAKDIDFKYNNQTFKSPLGVAHFLEHKMFEQEDGSVPFEQFELNGASANALTDYYKTSYLWIGPDKFEENMKILFNYVNNPYFTDKNVEKEKGIIIQELKMYDDSPFRFGCKKVSENLLINHPMQYDIGGTVESVSNITKEDLYKCYNAFYNPNNMYIVITGNIKPEKALKVIKKYYKKKNNNIKPEVKDYHEPETVKRKKETINMNVTIPKFFYGCKVNTDSYNINTKRWIQYLSIYLDALIGSTSVFAEELKEKKLITDSFDFWISPVDKYLVITILAESKHPAKLEKLVNEIITQKVDKKTFERKKKCFLSSIIKLTDNISGINNVITNDIAKYNHFDINLFNQIKNLNYSEFNQLIRKVDFSNTSVLYINPIKEK